MGSSVLPIPGGPPGEEAFPEGMCVHVTGGQHRDTRGAVIVKDPDLRPGSVWVRLTDGTEVLVSGYRLAPDVS